MTSSPITTANSAPAQPISVVDSPGVVPEPDPKQASPEARSEAAGFAHGRAESRQKHLHRAAIGVFWIFVGSFTLLFLIWVFHLAAPTSWRFLTDAQLNDLQTVLLSAVGSSFVTAAAKPWLKPDGEE